MNDRSALITKIAEGEHQKQDFKYAINDSKKIARSIGAFANSDGGCLLIGVKDNGKIAGIQNEEETFMIEAAAKLYCRPEIELSYIQHRIEGKDVLEVIVPKSELIHLCPDESGEWRMYFRKDDANLIANKTIYLARQKQLKTNTIPVRFADEEHLLFEWLERYITITLDQFCEIAEINETRANDILSSLLAIHILEVKIIEDYAIYMLREE